MSSRAARKFNNELIRLLNARTHWLKQSIWPVPGQGLSLTKARIRSAINRLQNYAELALLRSDYASDLGNAYDTKKQWHPKKAKATAFQQRSGLLGDGTKERLNPETAFTYFGPGASAYTLDEL
jgi:hypothetical protein